MVETSLEELCVNATFAIKNQREILEVLKLLAGKTSTEIQVDEITQLLLNPNEEDTKLQTIYKTPFVTGDIVISGAKTRATHPLTNLHSIHFKKTYLQKMSRWETSAKQEAVMSQHVWEHFQEALPNNSVLPAPLPLGATSYVYRSQLLTAKTLGSLSPVSLPLNPCQTLIQIQSARKKSESFHFLWEGLKKLNSAIDAFHSGGFLHLDLHRENLMIQIKDDPIPHIIDFETTQEDERFQTAEWKDAKTSDKQLFLQESALILLCLKEKMVPDCAFKALVMQEIEKIPILFHLKKNL